MDELELVDSVARGFTMILRSNADELALIAEEIGAEVTS